MRALLVPLKSFRDAKHRLSSVLSGPSREELARALARSVLHSEEALSRFVCCDDKEVADFAEQEGAEVLWTPRLGLSMAVASGVRELEHRGFSLAVVAHADLPFLPPLGRFGKEGAVTLGPDRRDDGTNVAAVPTSANFTFSYGAQSFHRHSEEATRLLLDLHVVRDWRIALDVDYPSDLALALMNAELMNDRGDSRVRDLFQAAIGDS